MGTRSVTVGDDWVLLGPTPIEVETHSTFDIFVTVAADMPTDPDYPAQRMRASVNPNRVFDTPNSNVYARSAEDHTADVVVVPRASIGGVMAMLAGLSQGLLTLNPDTGDVLQQGASSNGSDT